MEECEKCQDSGYIEKVSGGVWTGEGLQSRQVLCDCACGRDARDQEEGKRLHAPMTTETPVADVVPTLKAMAHNYSDRHCWDHLDARAVLAAADDITRLRAENAELQRKLDEAVMDTARLDALRDESWDLRCFSMHDDDIGWRVIGHWMAEPKERILGEAYTDEPRIAIDAALTSTLGEA